MSLQDKVAVVTGASSGIGAATVKALLKLGMKVVGVARRKERIEELAKGEWKGKLFAVNVDVRNTQEIVDMFIWVKENVGPVHVLINSAGIGTPTPIIKGSVDAWKSVFDTNFMSVATACQEAIKIMQENNIDGYIVNINSVAGHFDGEATMPKNVMYSASKRALTTLTENIRLELARMNSKIRITSLSPGLVKTDIMLATGLSEAKNEMAYSMMPYLLSEDVADTIVYILNTPLRVQIAELILRPTGENIQTSIFSGSAKK